MPTFFHLMIFIFEIKEPVFVLFIEKVFFTQRPQGISQRSQRNNFQRVIWVKLHSPPS